jgi:hypothetical protein
MARRLGMTVIGMAVVAAAVGYFRLRPPPSGDDSARMRALEARLATLEKQRPRSEVVTRTLTASEPRIVVPVAPGAGAEEPPARPTKGPRAAVPVDEAAVQREYFGDLDVRLGSETRDPVWAAATEEKLRNSVRELRPRVTVDNAQCAQTMCRVEASVPDPREDVAAMDRFISTTLALFPEAVLREGDGPGRHIVYLARKGTEFPPMTPAEAAQ